MEFPGSGGDDDAVCCMCGDPGLPGELFQCGLCRCRLQHRYCSELYPREAAYRSCNWCLREQGRNINPPAKAALAVASRRRRRDSSGNKMSPSCGCSTRTAFKAEPGKPVKKLKITRQGPGRTTAAASGRREVQAVDDRKDRRFRVKVRRYKLLAEVIC